MSHTRTQASFWRSEPGALPAPRDPPPYAGRIGANQLFSVDKSNCTDRELLTKYPDAAPWVPLRNSLSLKQFLEIGLWKAAAVEGIGTCLLVYLTILFPMGLAENMKNLSTGPVVPSLIGSVTVIFMLPLFIYTVGPVSGAHLNPTISIATFFGRLTTFPRFVLYVSFQIFGSAIAGWLVRASLNTRSFIVPGCYMDLSKVSVGSAFVIEFVTDTALILLSFGIGLDPRQRGVFGPTLGPIFVGVTLGVCIFSTSMILPGYTGFCMEPLMTARAIDILTRKYSRTSRSMLWGDDWVPFFVLSLDTLDRAIVRFHRPWVVILFYTTIRMEIGLLMGCSSYENAIWLGLPISCLLPVRSFVFWEINSALALIRLQSSEAKRHTF